MSRNCKTLGTAFPASSVRNRSRSMVIASTVLRPSNSSPELPSQRAYGASATSLATRRGS